MNKSISQSVMLLIFLSYTAIFFAQSEWSHYITRGESHEVEIYKNTAYVANKSGLLIIDLDSKEETLLHPGNHTVEIQGFRELEILDNGHMWLSSAAKGKLYYFDGENFTLHCDSIDQINNLLFANDRLWFTQGGTINSVTNLNQLDLYSVHGNQCINHGNLKMESMTRDQEGDFWYATKGAIKQFDGTTIVDSILSPNDYYWVNDHYIDSENRHWISYGTPLPFLDIYDGANWIETFSRDFIHQFYEFEDGKVTALYRDNEYVEFVNFQGQSITSFPKLPVDAFVLHLDNPESIWYTTERHFNTSRIFHQSVDISHEFMTHIDFFRETIIDLEQNCNGQLVSLSQQSIRVFDSDPPQQIPLVTQGKDCFFGAFIKDAFTCNILIAPAFVNSSRSCKAIWELSSDSIIENKLLPEQSSFLYRDELKNIYYTTISPAVIHKIDTLGNHTEIQVPDSRTVADIYFYNSSKMILTSFDEGSSKINSIRIFDNGVWSILGLGSLGLSDPNIGHLINVDNQGHVWFHEENGLIRYDGEELSYFHLGTDISESSRYNIVEDHYGSFWISTKEDGIIRWTQDSTFIYNTSNSELLSNSATELQIVDDYLWVNHYYALTKVKLEPIVRTATTQIFKELDYSIYPNPSSGHFYISNPSMQNRRIDIYDFNGALVSNATSSDREYHTILEHGLYYIRIREAGVQVTEKLIVIE